MTEPKKAELYLFTLIGNKGVEVDAFQAWADELVEADLAGSPYVLKREGKVVGKLDGSRVIAYRIDTTAVEAER